MKNKPIYLLLASLFLLFSGNAQSKKIEKANKSFSDFNFSKAIKQYESIVENGTNSAEVYQNLGDANYLNANYKDAAKWYKELSNLGNDALDREHLYRYAQSLRSINSYEASDELLNQLNVSTKSDQRGVNFEKNRDYLEAIKARLGSYSIENMAINSSESDFAPSFHLDGLVFSTARDSNMMSKSVHNWNRKRFLNLYTATSTEDGKFRNANRFSDELNSKLHESSTAFTKDGQTVYFTRNNGKGRKFSRDKEGISRLKIYKATFENGKWGKAVALPFNSDNYSVAHPTLNKTEDQLYFSSDMPGTLGKSDIFVVDINADGSYGTPKNLGKTVNTESKESFPFIADDNVLYFASDGHPGLGGMDIFATDLKDLENSRVLNLGEPLNSSADDFSLVINSTTKKGYFASNRADGKGSDDIYALTEVKPLSLACMKTISGIVKDNNTRMIVANAKVLLYNKKNKVIAETTSDDKGAFSLEGKCAEGGFSVVAQKETYEKDMLSLAGENKLTHLELLLVKLDKEIPLGTNLVTFLNIEPIYFDFNKSFIRKDAEISLTKIIAYLRKYPAVNIQITSHTDTRASNAYNKQLSDRRAKSTLQYLINKGINPNRLSAQGFGENKLANDCADNVKCSESQHQQNRRSDFITVK